MVNLHIRKDSSKELIIKGQKLNEQEALVAHLQENYEFRYNEVRNRIEVRVASNDKPFQQVNENTLLKEHKMDTGHGSITTKVLPN